MTLMRNHINNTGIKLFLTVVAISIVVIGGAGVVHAARKSTATVENDLQYGVQQAVGWDQGCRQHLQSGYMGQHFQGDGMGNLRTGGINNGASYVASTWMSKRGQGNATVPISVDYGTKSISLQINDVIFLCGTLVSKDIGSSGGGCNTSVSGKTLVNDSSRWVSSANNANDRAPNSFGAGCMHPAESFSRRKALSLDVISSPWSGTADIDGGTSKNCGPGDPSGKNCLNVWRDENSRYWTAPAVNFTYETSPSKPIDSAGTIHIKLNYKYFAAFFTTNEKAATKNCSGTGPDYVTGAYLDIDRCGTLDTDLYISIVLRYNYILAPRISTSPSLLREGDGNIQVTADVDNTGKTASDDVNWSVTRFIVAPGRNYSKSGSANAPCTQFSGYVGGSCTEVKNGTTKFAKGNKTVARFTDNLPSVPSPGSKVCYVTSVDKSSSASPTWKHSSVSCSTIERVPFVQVLGNDLRVGSTLSGANVAAGATSLVFNNAGSWVEYGILAPGNVSNIASESGANGGNGGTQSSWSKLTFANSGVPAGCSSGYGCFTGASNMGKIPDVSTFVKTASHNGAALNYDRGSASFNASDIPGFISGADLSSFSQSASVTTTGTITIDKDITYNSNSLLNANAIPQLILIANNINITGNVKHIDAWLIATGTINTCSDVAQTALRSGNCSNQLAVNGAIMANQLLLDRTYYNPSKPAETAESLNLRGDSYIWASNIAHQNGQWQTVYSTDLPPRY